MTTAVPAELDGYDLVVVDVEGNGHNPPEIVEIAVLPVGDTVTYTDVRSWTIRPQMPIAAVVTRTVHGISNLDVADCPSWSEVAATVGQVLEGRVLVAHNARVEYRVLRTCRTGDRRWFWTHSAWRNTCGRTYRATASANWSTTQTST
jgi:exodeoxyribonuclease X